jgi:vancomycin resistance protein VanW
MGRRLTQRSPLLYRARVRELCLERCASDRRRRVRFATSTSAEPLRVEVVRHGSLLRRRLGSSDPRLQETKIVNLRLAAAALDGLLIRPGEVFSFWRWVGEPSRRRGFAEGLLLEDGEVRSGIGGGLCQMSNLLYWMALHTPLEVVEQHHHGFDPFPDDRRVLPFGSGATIFYNYVDLRLRNPTGQVFQIATHVTDTHLRGAIRSESPWPVAFHVEEKGHRFSGAADGSVYRDNELWRRSIDRRTGETVLLELIARNHSLVKYAVPESRIDGRDGTGSRC